LLIVLVPVEVFDIIKRTVPLFTTCLLVNFIFNLSDGI